MTDEHGLEDYPRLHILWASGKSTLHAFTQSLTFNCEPAFLEDGDRPVLIDVVMPNDR